MGQTQYETRGTGSTWIRTMLRLRNIGWTHSWSSWARRSRLTGTALNTRRRGGNKRRHLSDAITKQKTRYLTASAVFWTHSPTKWKASVILTWSPGLPVSPVPPWGPGRPCTRRRGRRPGYSERHVNRTTANRTKRRRSHNLPGIRKARRIRALPSLHWVPEQEEKPTQWWETSRHVHVVVFSSVKTRYIQKHRNVREHRRHRLCQKIPVNQNPVINCFCAYFF